MTIRQKPICKKAEPIVLIIVLLAFIYVFAFPHAWFHLWKTGSLPDKILCFGMGLIQIPRCIYNLIKAYRKLSVDI
jgi:hypothetical protein